MKHISIGGLEVSRIGLGAMSMSGYYNLGAGSDAESIRTIHRALELGVTHIDTAEIYGPYTNEELVGRAIKGRRDHVVLATKFGLVSHGGEGPGALDSRPSNIRVAVVGSLKRLGTDHIDLYYQHRVDPKTPIEDTIGVLSELVAEGKVRYIGLSEASPATIRRAHAVHPSPHSRPVLPLDARPRGRTVAAAPPARDRVRPVLAARPWLPHGRDPVVRELSNDDWRKSNPRFSDENIRRNLSIVDEVRAIGSESGATPAQVAWLGCSHKGMTSPDPRYEACRPSGGEHGG